MATKTIPITVRNKIKTFLKEIEQDGVPITEAYLFGSYAKGTANKWSDIDICIVSKDFGNKIKSPFQYLSKKQRELKEFDIEPVAFHPTDLKDKYNSIVNEILKTGVKVY